LQQKQLFLVPAEQRAVLLDWLSGVELFPLAVPVPEGSIHRARLKAGVSIPTHVHPADEHVLVLSGSIKTGSTVCGPGTFWSTPAGVRQGPHSAITDVELLTIRLGAMGPFNLA
jgi:anti-sigma factor ChrR (cupin superfamily)